MYCGIIDIVDDGNYFAYYLGVLLNADKIMFCFLNTCNACILHAIHN